VVVKGRPEQPARPAVLDRREIRVIPDHREPLVTPVQLATPEPPESRAILALLEFPVSPEQRRLW
jgi:hypothetical protein